jgi:hypothetical protein
MGGERFEGNADDAGDASDDKKKTFLSFHDEISKRGRGSDCSAGSGSDSTRRTRKVGEGAQSATHPPFHLARSS